MDAIQDSTRNSSNDERTLPITEDKPMPTSPSEDNDDIKASTTNLQRIVRYLRTDISLDHADIPVISTCIVSGLCDSSAYNAWSCFVSMQTGNTVFLALGVSGQPITHPYGWLKSLLSIVTFLVGCVFFASTRYFDPKARGTLALSFFLQSCCIIVAAALVQANVVASPVGMVVLGGTHVDFKELIPLAFLAFQSGGQIVTSRLLGFNEVPTTVLTSVYCDLSSDPNFFKRDNVKRNRRLASVLAFLVGGIAGGWISRSSAGLAVNFWIAAAIKMAIAVGWTVWKPDGAIQL